MDLSTGNSLGDRYGYSGGMDFFTGNSTRGTGSFNMTTGQSMKGESGSIVLAVGKGYNSGGNLYLLAGDSSKESGGNVKLVSGASSKESSGQMTIKTSDGGQSGSLNIITGDSDQGLSGDIYMKTGSLFGSEYHKTKAGSIIAEVGFGNAGDGGDIGLIAGHTTARKASGGFGKIFFT